MLTTEQLLIRRKTIGASESSAALGLSKYKTPVAVYLEKIGMSEMREDSEAMYWGREFEEPIARRYSAETGKEVISCEPVISEKYSFMSCNLDRKIVGENAAVECKNVGFFSDDWGQPGTDQIPTDYLIQIAHQAIVCDLDYVALAALGNRYNFRVYRYERNEKLEKSIISGLHKFWHENVLKEIAPEPKTCEDLGYLFKDEGTSIEASSDIQSLVQQYNEKKEEKKLAEDAETAIKVQIAAFMGSASILTLNGDKLATYKAQESTRIDSAKLKELMPEIYEEYSKTSSFRVFRSK